MRVVCFYFLPFHPFSFPVPREVVRMKLDRAKWTDQVNVARTSRRSSDLPWREASSPAGSGTGLHSVLSKKKKGGHQVP
jgi:hypothetical protein